MSCLLRMLYMAWGINAALSFLLLLTVLVFNVETLTHPVRHCWIQKSSTPGGVYLLHARIWAFLPMDPMITGWGNGKRWYFLHTPSACSTISLRPSCTGEPLAPLDFTSFAIRPTRCMAVYVVTKPYCWTLQNALNIILFGFKQFGAKQSRI